MLVEFDDTNTLVPSLSSIFAPLKAPWIVWLGKEVALKASYGAMLRGRT